MSDRLDLSEHTTGRLKYLYALQSLALPPHLLPNRLCVAMSCSIVLLVWTRKRYLATPPAPDALHCSLLDKFVIRSRVIAHNVDCDDLDLGDLEKKIVLMGRS